LVRVLQKCVIPCFAADDRIAVTAQPIGLPAHY
jgi:hypothetical protein